jgi:hypothetical protein
MNVNLIHESRYTLHITSTTHFSRQGVTRKAALRLARDERFGKASE